jgi:hypothetical protein
MRAFLLQKVTPAQLYRSGRNLVLVLAGLLLLVSLLFWRMWQIRGQVTQIGWPPSMIASEPGDRVTATWLGTTTVLFDDGETQVLIDGPPSFPCTRITTTPWMSGTWQTGRPPWSSARSQPP